MPHSKFINVPCQLLQEVQRDSMQRSLLALSVAIKCWSPSSVYICHSVKQMRRDFNIGKQRAEKLLKGVGASPLFLVSRTQDNALCITARCYRHHYAHRVQYGNHKPTSAMTVAKVTCRERQSLRLQDIDQELKELLTLMIINAKNRKDEFITKHPTAGVPSHAARFLSVNGLAKLSGCSDRTIIRRTHHLEQERQIAVRRYPLIRVCDNIYHAPLSVTQDLICIGALGFRRPINDYELLQWDMRKRFQHILFGHRKRLQHRHTTVVMSQTDLHALYD